MQVLDYELIDREQLGDNYFVIYGRLHPNPLSTPLPGQFCQIKCDDPGQTQILWRPYSWLTIEGDVYSMLVQRVGAGSKAICNQPFGSKQPIITHLGRPFEFPFKDQSKEYKVALVAGGVGLAPMLMVSNYIRKNYPNVGYSFIFGGRDRPAVFPDWLNKYESNVAYCTEDGSFGRQGFVTLELAAQLEHTEFDAVYTCGPNAMMSAVSRLVHGKVEFAQASLEARMACGIGVCYGCAIPYTNSTNMKTVCKDGPVFNLFDVSWDLVE